MSFGIEQTVLGGTAQKCQLETFVHRKCPTRAELATASGEFYCSSISCRSRLCDNQDVEGTPAVCLLAMVAHVVMVRLVTGRLSWPSNRK